MSFKKILDLTSDYTWNDYRTIMRSGLDIYDSNVTIPGSKKTLFEVQHDKKYNQQREFKKDEESYLKGIIKFAIRDILPDWMSQFKKEELLVNNNTGIYRSIENPFMICKPMYDCIYQDDKCGLLIGIQDYMPRDWNDEEKENIPDKNKAWAYHLMAVMGYERTLIFILNNWQLEMRIVENNQIEINDLILAEKEIWDKYIIGNENAEVTGFDIDLIDEIYSNKKSVALDCSPILHAIKGYYNIVQIESSARKYDKDKKTYKAQIKKYLENSDNGFTDEFIIKNGNTFSVKLKSSVKLK